MTTSLEDYQMANDAFNVFFPAWDAAREDYRAMRIGDAEFLAFKAKRDELIAAIDAAASALA